MAPIVVSVATSFQLTAPVFTRSSVMLPSASPTIGMVTAPPTPAPKNPIIYTGARKRMVIQFI